VNQSFSQNRSVYLEREDCSKIISLLRDSFKNMGGDWIYWVNQIIQILQSNLDSSPSNTKVIINLDEKNWKAIDNIIQTYCKGLGGAWIQWSIKINMAINNINQNLVPPPLYNIPQKTSSTGDGTTVTSSPTQTAAVSDSTFQLSSPSTPPINEEQQYEEGNNRKVKKCPYCAEEILYDAVVCKHCGRELVHIPTAAEALTLSKAAMVHDASLACQNKGWILLSESNGVVQLLKPKKFSWLLFLALCGFGFEMAFLPGIIYLIYHTVRKPKTVVFSSDENGSLLIDGKTDVPRFLQKTLGVAQQPESLQNIPEEPQNNTNIYWVLGIIVVIVVIAIIIAIASKS